MNKLWVEKYKPEKIDDFFLSYPIKNKIKLWINNFKTGKSKTNCLFLYGPPGLGKTTIAHVILKEYNYNVTELNSSEFRSSKKIKDKLKDILGKKHVLNLFQNVVKETGIIMDEIDGLTLGERSSLTEIMKTMFPKKKDIKDKNAKFRYLKKNPFICISNSLDKKLNELKTKSVFINLVLPNKIFLKNCCIKILNEEKKEYNDEILDLIINKSQFDYRRLITILEYCFRQNKEILTTNKIKLLLENFEKKKIDKTSYKYVESFLNTYNDINISISNYESNKNTISMLIYENFIEFINKNKKDSDNIKIKNIIDIFDNFSISDKIDYKIYINQFWDLYCYNAIFKCIEPSFKMNKLNNYDINRTNNITFSTLLNKTSFEFLNLKTTSLIENKIFKSSETLKLYHLYEYIEKDSENYNKIIINFDLIKEEIDKLLKIYKMS